ncbi:MAG: hypothetical protein WAU52_16270 [Burkholderiales bacterium]
MTRLIGRAGVAAVFCALTVAPLAYGANKAPATILPSQNAMTPNRSVTNPALTLYTCPAQFKVSWSHKLMGYTGGGWSELQIPLPMVIDYVFNGPPSIYLGQMYCPYTPAWLHGRATPNGIFFDFDVMLVQPVGEGTCLVRPDRLGFECRK